MLNRNYGKLRDDARIIYAPSEVKVGNTYYPAPTAEQYAACGYYPIDSTKPEKDGAYFVLFRPPFRRPFATESIDDGKGL